MNCLLLDDEQPALDLLEDNARQIPFLNIVAATRSPMEALACIRTQAVDLVLLDINMPGLSGLELLRSLPNKPMAILITAYAEHALEGFNLDVVDYLVKPVAFHRFLKAVQKAHELYRSRQHAKPTETENDYFYVNAGYSLVKVSYSEITYMESLKDYVKINLTGGRNLITRLAIKSIEEKLHPSRFMRVHRSFVVALHKIEQVQKNRLLIEGQEIPIGDNFRAKLNEHITQKNL